MDIKNITQLISDFRAVTAKDAVTPETLGYLLQRLADLIATAGESDTLNDIKTLVDKYRAAGSAVTNIEQGKADRNNVYGNLSLLNLGNGSRTTETKVLVQQATTDRAGAMRAQQVIDLNAAKRDIATIQTVLAKPTCVISDGKLQVVGAKNLLQEGYVPYIFRSVRKRNPFKDNTVPESQRKSYCFAKKGWALFGSMYSVKIVGTSVQFSTEDHDHLCVEQTKFSSKPTALVQVTTSDSGDARFGWGRSSVRMLDRFDRPRMIRLRFAIAFGKPHLPGRYKITPTDMVTPLAEFSVVFTPGVDKWCFSRT